MPTYYGTHPDVGHKKTDKLDKITEAIVDSYGNVGNEYNKTAVEDNFYHLVVAEPDKTAVTKDDKLVIPAYEPLDLNQLKLPLKDDTPLGPAAACAANCQANYNLRQTQCDILRERVAQALRDGHCPSLIKAVAEFNPCGGGAASVTTAAATAAAPACPGNVCNLR